MLVVVCTVTAAGELEDLKHKTESGSGLGHSPPINDSNLHLDAGANIFKKKKSFSGRYTLRESRCRILYVLVPILPKGNIMDVIYALSADGWVFVEGSPVPYVVDSDLSNELSNLYFFLVPSRSVTIASVGPHQRSPQLALDAISSSTPNRPPCDPLPVVPVAIFDSDSNVVPRPTLAFSVVETRSLESAREDHGGCISSNNFTSSSETCSIHTFSSRWPWDREL